MKTNNNPVKATGKIQIMSYHSDKKIESENVFPMKKQITALSIAVFSLISTINIPQAKAQDVVYIATDTKLNISPVKDKYSIYAVEDSEGYIYNVKKMGMRALTRDVVGFVYTKRLKEYSGGGAIYVIAGCSSKSVTEQDLLTIDQYDRPIFRDQTSVTRSMVKPGSPKYQMVEKVCEFLGMD